MIDLRLGPASAALLLGSLLLAGAIHDAGVSPRPVLRIESGASSDAPVGNGSAVANFSAALNRIVTLIGAAGGAILAIAWTRVALSWFSNDVAKKVQAKDRARDALVGSLIFAAALSGLLWGLATWVLGGS